MNLCFHFIAEHGIYQLVLLYQVFTLKGRADDNCVEMASIAIDFNPGILQALLYPLFDILRHYHYRHTQSFIISSSTPLH